MIRGSSRGTSALTLLGLLFAQAILVRAEANPLDQFMPPIGGPGGGYFTSRCDSQSTLSGVFLNVGDDVDAIRIVCRKSTSPTAGPGYVETHKFGGGGGTQQELVCPDPTPMIASLEVTFEGRKTTIVNGVHLFCTPGMANQPVPAYPNKMWEGGPAGGASVLLSDRATCPSGLVAVGITGRSGIWLDALSLICGPRPEWPPQPPAPQPRSAVTSIGRVNTGVPVPKNPVVHTICDAARDALGRKSPAASNLVTQCRAQGGNATTGPSNIDLETARARGETLAAGDDALDKLRSSTPESDRRGFEIGLGIWAGNTAPGPGKQSYHDALTATEQRGFDLAAAYSLPRNKYDALVKVGLAIDAADAEVRAARQVDGDPFYWLGFDIASGLFGDPAAGSQGSKVLGAGAIAIRDSLNYAGKRGFNASMKLQLGRNYP